MWTLGVTDMGTADKPHFIERVNAKGLHGRFDLDISFQEEVNIVHGVNGSGKTTLLHIIANLLTADLERFRNLEFRSIELTTSAGETVGVSRDKLEGNVALSINGQTVPDHSLDDREEDRRRQLRRARRLGRYDAEPPDHARLELDATYFPAFRTMIEAWAIMNDDTQPRRPFQARRYNPQSRHVHKSVFRKLHINEIYARWGDTL